MTFRTRIILAPLVSLAGAIVLLAIPFLGMETLQKSAREISLLAERQALIDRVDREMLSHMGTVYRTIAIGSADGGGDASGGWSDDRLHSGADDGIFPGGDGWLHYFEPDAELEGLWRNFEMAAGASVTSTERASNLHSAGKALGDRLTLLRDATAREQRRAIHATRHVMEGAVITVGAIGLGFSVAVFILIAICVRDATLRLNCTMADISEISAEMGAMAQRDKSAGGDKADIRSESLATLASALDGVNDDLVDLLAGRRWRRPTDSFGYPLPPGGNPNSLDDDFADF